MVGAARALRSSDAGAAAAGEGPAIDLASFTGAPAPAQRQLAPALLARPAPYAARRPRQPAFPPFPTTTIGSFPQTPAIRRARLAFKRGRLRCARLRRAALCPERLLAGLAASPSRLPAALRAASARAATASPARTPHPCMAAAPAPSAPARSAAEYRERMAAEIGFAVGAQVRLVRASQSWLGWAGLGPQRAASRSRLAWSGVPPPGAAHAPHGRRRAWAALWATVSSHLAAPSVMLLCPRAQEALGLDVLVHGEPERSDMVEYFGLKLDGYWFSGEGGGWVRAMECSGVVEHLGLRLGGCWFGGEAGLGAGARAGGEAACVPGAPAC